MVISLRSISCYRGQAMKDWNVNRPKDIWVIKLDEDSHRDGKP